MTCSRAAERPDFRPEEARPKTRSGPRPRPSRRREPLRAISSKVGAHGVLTDRLPAARADQRPRPQLSDEPATCLVPTAATPNPLRDWPTTAPSDRRGHTTHARTEMKLRADWLSPRQRSAGKAPRHRHPLAPFTRPAGLVTPLETAAFGGMRHALVGGRSGASPSRRSGGRPVPALGRRSQR